MQGEEHNSQTEGEPRETMLKQTSGASSYTQSTRRDFSVKQRCYKTTNSHNTHREQNLSRLASQPKNHSFLVEEIRKNVPSLERKKWSIQFSWVKSHAGTRGNEIADRLAKEAARSGGTEYEFARIPESTIYQEARESARQKWQRGWATSHKAAATRQYFPTLQDRLRKKIKLTPKITAVLTGHGMTKACLLAPVPPE